MSVVLLASLACRADIKTIVGRNKSAAAASPAFTFDQVPRPSRNDAATEATFTLVDGTPDANGGGVERLNDGVIPAGQDDPADNFFFAPNTAGGRIAVDLGAAIEIAQVNTYSWHGDDRGPQVYALYAADGTADGFDAGPKQATDPRKAGWTLVASVDTRPPEGDPGGQYGVSVRNPDGVVGKYRYLLFDVARTENADPFGNTFYSEIDVIDRKAPAAAIPADPPAPGITVDTSGAPEMKAYGERVKKLAEEWYPLITAKLPSNGFVPPARVTIAFRKDYEGVAEAAGNRVVCSAKWFTDHPDDLGAIVHELVHVVQQYGRGDRPGWLVEGIADYIRFYHYEPPENRLRPDPDRSKYSDSYRTSAAFLHWAQETYDKDLVVKLNAACRRAEYGDDLWERYTKKSLEELGREWRDSLRP